MDKQSYLIRPRDRTLNFCLSLSSSSFPIGPSCFHVRMNSLPLRGSSAEIFRDRFFYFFFFFFFFAPVWNKILLWRFITMPIDKYWLKRNIGSKQVFQVVVIKKRGGEGLFSSTFSSMMPRRLEVSFSPLAFYAFTLLMKFSIFLLVCMFFFSLL